MRIIMYKTTYVVFLALVFAIYVTTCAAAITPTQNDSLPEKATPWYLSQNPEEKKLALERNQFLDRVWPRYGIQISSTPEQYGTVIFPFGRSDRMYALLWGMYINGHPVNRFYCFQRKHGKDKLLYTFGLGDRRLHDKKVKKVNSLLNFIYDLQCDIIGQISRYAKNDLTQISNYVGYSVKERVELLEVFIISDSDTQNIIKRIHKEPLYVDEDSHSKKKMEVYQFFKTYGLPVLPGELTKEIPK